MILSTEDLNILRELLKENEVISFKTLASRLNISEAGLRYRVNKLSDWLEGHSLPRILIEKRKGIKVREKENIESFLEKIETEIDIGEYSYAQSISVNFLIMRCINTNRPVTAREINGTLNISGPTLKQYVKKANTFLETFGLEVQYQKRLGYQIVGSLETEENIFYSRLLASVEVTEIISYLKDGETSTKKGELILYNVFDLAQTETIVQAIAREEEETKKVFTDVEFIQKFVKMTLESNHLDVSIVENKELDEFAEEFTDRLIQRVGSIFAINFVNGGSDFRATLLTHILSLTDRIGASHEFINPILDDLANDQSIPYNVIDEAIVDVYQSLRGDELLDENERSLIAIYFVSEIERRQRKLVNSPNVLVVCPEGRLISNILANQLRSMFDVSRVEASSLHELTPSIAAEYDLVITTVQLNRKQYPNSVRVNGQIDESTISRIAKILPIRFGQRNGLNYFSQIIEVIRNNTSVNNIAKIEFMLLNILSSSPPQKNQEITDVQFEPEFVQISNQKIGWQRAIDLATEPLIRKGIIEPRYARKIKQNTVDYGPYMVVAPGVFFAHAGLDDGIASNGIAVLKLTKGVHIIPDQADPIDLIVVLAFKNSEGNSVFENSVKLVRDGRKLRNLRKLNTKQKIYSFIQTEMF